MNEQRRKELVKVVHKAAEDGKVRRWQVSDGNLLATLAAGPVRSLAFTLDGSILATAGTDRVVRLWPGGP